jgi:hypothetical protein
MNNRHHGADETAQNLDVETRHAASEKARKVMGERRKDPPLRCRRQERSASGATLSPAKVFIASA